MVELSASLATTIAYPAYSVGANVPLAQGTRRGVVIAVFRSSFYVSVDDRLFCVGSRAIPSGPLNVITTAPANTDWLGCGLRKGAKAQVSNSLIHVGGRFRFPLNGARLWSPPTIQAPIDPEALANGLTILRELAGPTDGLAPFIEPGFVPASDAHVCCAAESGIVAAQVWLARTLSSTADSPTWIKQLMGLGPGLTPSGDDLLGGMMMALHALGEGTARDAIWEAIGDTGEGATNAISMAHLEAAARGMASEPVHRAFSSVVSGDSKQIDAAASAIDEIGHTSGWDIMAGIVLVLDAWQGKQLA